MFVKLWMSEKIITIDQESSISEANELMEQNQIRRLPVTTENNQLVGILSKEDIVNAMPSAIDASYDQSARSLAGQAQVKAFMTNNPITVGPMDPLENVASSMRKHKVGGFPVVQNDSLIGVITESDIFQAFIQVLGTDEEGVRIELTIDQGAKSLYETIDIFKKHKAFLRAVTICKDYSKDRQLLTIRVQGDDLEPLIDEMWQSGCQINSILNEVEKE